MILLIAEVHASEAILAALAVIAKVAIGAVSTVAAEVAVIAFLDIHTFIAQFGFFRKSAVYAIAAKSNPKAVIAVFGLYMTHEAVAVFSGGVIRTVVGVLASHGEDIGHGPRLAERLETLEEIHR